MLSNADMNISLDLGRTFGEKGLTCVVWGRGLSWLGRGKGECHLLHKG